MVLGRFFCLAVLAFLVEPAGTLGGLQIERVGVRLIVVETEPEANQIHVRVGEGESIDGLARELSTDTSRGEGGYLGRVVVAELRMELQDVLSALEPGDLSPPIRIGNEYFLVGFLSEQDQNWIDQNARGLQALGRGDTEEAERAFTEALEEAEGFGAADYRFVESLKDLADIHYSLEDFALARSLYQRLVTLLDREIPGAGPARLAEALNGMGEIGRSEGDFASAEASYARALDILEEFQGPEDGVATVLGNLALVREAIGDYAGAEVFARRALTIFERVLGPEDPTLATGLNNLAFLLERQEKYDDAEAVARQALAIMERVLGANHPETATSLNHLASVLEAQRRYTEAQGLYRRLLTLDWEAPFARDEDPSVIEVLEPLTVALQLAPFGDEEFSEAFDLFEAAVDASPPREAFSLALGRLLSGVGLWDEAAALLRGATQVFPDSMALRAELAEVYLENSRLVQALEEVERGSQIDLVPGADPVDYRSGQGYFYSRMGDIHLRLVRFEESLAAYGAAIEIDPAHYDAHVGVGVLHFQTDGFDQARASYTRAVEIDPDRVEAYFRLAEANLHVGRFQESYAAAEKALEIGPEHLEVRFIKSRALQLMGRADEARVDRERYQELEARRQDLDERLDEAESLRETAASVLAEGLNAEAIELYENAIQAHPDIVDFHLELGSALGRMGRHQESASTFERMIEMGTDDFLVHKHLAREYEFLADTESSQRHETVYLRKLYASLRESIN